MEDPSNPLIEGELEADGFSLIDGSELEDLFVSMSEPRMEDDKANTVDGGVNILQRPDAEKPRKNEKYNLRKSLAWDSAFFTSAGVLDAEELSSIMDVGNGGKHQMQQLPGIQEDISRSTESLSTLESDNLTIESLEADLFSDIRASIQRSGESSNLRKSNLKGGPQEPSHLGKKTSEIKLGNLVKPKSTPKKLITNIQGDGKLVKLGPSRELVKKPMVSKREPSSSLLKPAAASGKGSSSLLKPAAASGKGSSMVMAPASVPTKRMSISAGRMKLDNNKVGSQTAAGRVTNASNIDQTSEARSIFSKAATHAKTSSGSSTTNRTGVSSARSSVDSTSSSSQSSRILPLNGLQGKTNRPVGIPPPGVKSRISSRVPVKLKNPPSSSRISAKLSALMLSSNVSPTSSISEWSSSSSTFTANQENRDCSSLDRTFSSDSIASHEMQIHPNQQSSSEHEIEVATESGISALDFQADYASVSKPVSAKPSGLRMPSPKIGFFDGVKSGGRTQNALGNMQSRSRLSSSRLPRTTTGSSSPAGVPNKGRIGNATAKTTVLTPAKVNPDTPKSNPRMTANGGGISEGMSNASNKESNVRVREDATKRTPLKTNEEKNSAAAKIPVGQKHHSEIGTGSRKKNELNSPSKGATQEDKYQVSNPMLNAPNNESNVRAWEDVAKGAPLKSNEKHNSAATKIPVGEKNHSESGSISRKKKSGLFSSSKNVISEGKSHFQGNQASNGLEADSEIMEMNNDSKLPSAQILPKLINGATVNTELRPTCVSEEVGAEEADRHIMDMKDDSEVLSTQLLHEPISEDDAHKDDENAYTVALNGDNEKHDHACAVEADHHIMKMNDSSEVLSVQLLHESINGDHANKVDENADKVVNVDKKKNDQVSAVEADQNITEPKSDSEVLSAELTHETINEDNAIKVDKNDDAVVLNVDNKKNDQVSAAEADQQHVIELKGDSEVLSNPIKVDENDEKNGQVSAVKADQLVMEPKGDSEMHSAQLIPETINEDDQICDVFAEQRVNGLIANVDAMDSNVKSVSVQADLSASLKTLEAKPAARTPLVDKNSSSPDTYSMEVLLKSFTSLSLDNV